MKHLFYIFLAVLLCCGVVGSAKSTLDVVATHAELFSGETWYVATHGNNSYDGNNPDLPFLTIAYAESRSSAGDRIIVEAGDYTEEITSDVVGLELHGEIGAVVTGSYTITADANLIEGMIFAPASGGGIEVNADYCKIWDTHVVGTPDTAFKVEGDYNILEDCMARGYSATGFEFQGVEVHGYRLLAHGDGGARRGFYFSHTNADDSFLEQCSSIGNGTASFHLITGVSNVLLNFCASGGGDGRWIDVDNANVFSNFSFADEQYYSLEFTDNSTTFNLFKVIGTIEIEFIYSHVEATLNDDIGVCYLRLFDSGVSPDITDNPGVALDSYDTGTFIGKTAVATVNLTVNSSAGAVVYENTTFQKPRVTTILTAKSGTDTYIQLVSDDNIDNKDGTIHWHCKFNPLSDDGWLMPYTP